MNPKDKATELIERYESCISKQTTTHNNLTQMELVKECAKITVDEIIEVSKLTFNPGIFNDKRTWHYWMQVKEEIELM